ncbi:MAG: PDZ domain-containing protein [Actinomycetota bacterium]
MITSVQPDAPAAKAGMQQNDVITMIDGREINTMEDVVNLLVEHKPGDKVKVTFIRGSESKEVEVELGKRPARL